MVVLSVMKLQLYGIIKGQTITDPINRMITITKYVSFTHLGLVNQDKSGPINSGVLKLFCITTLSKHFQNFRDPKMLQTTTNLR